MLRTTRRSCLTINFLLINVLLLGQAVLTAAEALEAHEVELFCYPELHKNTRKSCECIENGSPPWGLRTLTIDCSFKNLLTAEFSEILPWNTDLLDLTWNQLERVPVLVSDSLTQLNLMHNNITMIMGKNFIKMTNLRELYLSWNSIQSVEANAFAELKHLQVLDLSHNNLHNLPLKIFAPLPMLESLDLSWNRLLNQTASIQELDFYQTFGVNNKLLLLKLKACNLNNIVLPQNAALKELNLRRNLLSVMPLHLPDSLEILDLSENLFESLEETDTKGLGHIHELYMEDMSQLQVIAENSFKPLESLEKVSFQNSRRLVSMHEYAFGQKATSSPKLHSMIFRGTSLRGFNSTLSPIFSQLANLDLKGMPLHCDCNLVWLKKLQLETNGRCLKPSHLRGVSFTKALVDDFKCETFPRWLYGLIIMALIIIFAVCSFFIVVGLRPHSGVTMRRKVGAGSPYARVTIEPNRQEYY